MKKGKLLKFRLNLDIYPERVVRKYFVRGRKSGRYYVFEVEMSERDLYERLSKVLEEVVE